MSSSRSKKVNLEEAIKERKNKIFIARECYICKQNGCDISNHRLIPRGD